MPGFTIDPAAWYTEHELREAGMFTEAALKRARERDGLRCKEIRRGHRVYRGSWLLKWLGVGRQE